MPRGLELQQERCKTPQSRKSKKQRALAHERRYDASQAERRSKRTTSFRRVQYAFNGDSLRTIVSRMDVDFDRLLYDNRQLCDDLLSRSCFGAKLLDLLRDLLLGTNIT
jgi:hypothetical protein